MRRVGDIDVVVAGVLDDVAFRVGSRGGPVSLKRAEFLCHA